MDKFEQLDKAKNLLAQALSVALNSLPNNRSVVEASGHIKSAITKIDGVVQKKAQLQKKKMSQNQFETWWGNIQSGTAQQAMAPIPMSAEAQQRTLAQLNSMLANEQAKLDELEKKAPTDNSNIPNELLQD